MEECRKKKELCFRFRLQLTVVDSGIMQSTTDTSIAMIFISILANYMAALYGFGSLFSLVTDLLSVFPLFICFALRFEITLEFYKI